MWPAMRGMELLIKFFVFNESGSGSTFGPCKEENCFPEQARIFPISKTGRWQEIPRPNQKDILLRAPSKNHDLGSLKQNCAINQQRHVFQIKQVKFKFPFGIIEAGAVAKPHLRPSR